MRRSGFRRRLLLWLVAALLVASPAIPGAPPVAERLPIPRGLKGLRFGMTEKEVKKKLPGLLHWRELPPLTIGPVRDRDDGFYAAELEVLKRQLPGMRAMAETTIGSMRATCDFWFLVRGRLSRMTCLIELERDKGRFLQARKAVLDTLRNKYGPSTPTGDLRSSDGFGGPSWEDDRTWTWKDDNARLELRTDFMAIGDAVLRSDIVIDNTAAEHSDLIARTQAAVDRAYKQALEDKVNQARAEGMTLKRHQRRLDQDL
jgi:hypothetical protein